ncbi:hypothetical protein F7725_024537 [Dissostichus mawsoni]|uniref:Uncharacterized protein n=1 Tax=Dissostichus mawsoni TaxID=36200 RepID=A0A7J5XZN3_DISMA|nr:hypothetical protein F7725_024537 [Dissostichus mawsoni]
MRSPVFPFYSGLANMEGSEQPPPLRSDASRAHVKKSSSRLLILLLLLLSGNVNINPGPEFSLLPCSICQLRMSLAVGRDWVFCMLPSAIMDATTSLTELLSTFSSEIILLGDLNWDWLSDKSSQ